MTTLLVFEFGFPGPWGEEMARVLDGLALDIANEPGLRRARANVYRETFRALEGFRHHRHRRPLVRRQRIAVHGHPGAMSDMQMIAWCETTRSGAALTACVIENEDLWLTISTGVNGRCLWLPSSPAVDLTGY